MEIQAIWKDGVFKPLTPVNLNRTIVTIKVPDESIASIAPDEENVHRPVQRDVSARVRRQADKLLYRLAKIHEAILTLPEDRLTAVSQKQLDRLEAIEMREER